MTDQIAGTAPKTAPKTALITGASSGIGLGISKALARAGYSLALTGLEETGHEFAKSLAREFGVSAHFKIVDLRDPDAITQFVEESSKKLGTISVLVNNAGIQHVAPIDEFPKAKWNAIMDINLSAVFHLCQAAWSGMKTQNFGRIINISSVHGLRASEYKSAYVAAKHGVVGLTKVLALEGAPFNITANAICPGWVKTPLVEKQVEEQARLHKISPEQVMQDVMLKKQAVKDFVPVELIADLTLLLASEGARLWTGASIPLDGAWSVQ